MKRLSLAVGASILVSVVACGGSATTAKPAAAPAPVASAPPPAPAPAPGHALRRSAVKAAVRAGLPIYLQKIEFDDQGVKKDGKFVGFRVAALKDPAFWSGVDLRPGDVITRVNGMPIERPEQALEAFHALEVASELRVTYERDGASHELSYMIVEDSK
jgi:S1-C subfamily serine protease